MEFSSGNFATGYVVPLAQKHLRTFKIKFQTDETKCSELMLTWLHSKESKS